MKPRVLVVDDEPDYLELLEFTLTGCGFEVLKATNGLQALHEARRHLPNVIVLDLMLPDLDGFTVGEILRAQPSTSEVPIVVFSATEMGTARERTARFEPSRCLSKGTDLATLADGVRAALEQARTRTQARLASDEDVLCDSSAGI